MRLSPVLRGWLVWYIILLVSTYLLLQVDSDVQQEQASLTMLLIVLGGSLAGGRPLGFTLAIVSTAFIDLFFQQPLGFLTIPQPLDVVVLLAFLAASFVTTELLTRARQEAKAAEARKSEVETLSKLGAETLRYASAEEALQAIGMLVQNAIGVDECTVLPWQRDRGVENQFLRASTLAMFNSDAATAISRAVESGIPSMLDSSGHILEYPGTDIGAEFHGPLRTRLLVLPLKAEERTIGVLVVNSASTIVLDAEQRRLLAALSYYAALGVERMRLMSEAAYSEALREAQRAKEEVFAAVSHDLRTPISTIKVLAQGGADRGEHAAIVIVEQADRLARLVGDLVDMSRFRTGATRLTPELNTAEDLIGAALRQVEGTRQGRKIEVTIDFDSPALVGHFDFVHTLRIIGNLLDNALRHSQADGVVEIAAERTGGLLVISVSDRGTGIPAAERERIFEPFYRPADTVPDGGHAGLGLSIARSLAEMQGGDVSYADRDGGGSVFVLRLPAADVEDLSAVDA